MVGLNLFKILFKNLFIPVTLGIDRIDANERKHEHPVNVNVHNRTYSDNFAYKRPKTNLYDD